MKVLAVTRVVAIITSGLMAGLLFGDWLGPSFARSAMDLSSFVRFQQIIHENYVRVLPALSMPASMLPLVWLVLLRRIAASRTLGGQPGQPRQWAKRSVCDPRDTLLRYSSQA